MTLHQRWLAGKYLLYKLLSNLWFVSSVWLYFYRLFITDQQVGILDGMAFAIGLVAEVPSGALADRFGRDRIVKTGYLLATTGYLIQAFGNNFLPFFIGQSIFMIGASFISGADEALFFENLNFRQHSLEWRRLVTRGSQVALAGTLVATVAGSWLHTVNPRFPWIATAFSLIAAILLIWTVSDKRKKGSSTFSGGIKEYSKIIKAGFIEFLSPRLRMYLPIIITVQGLFYTVGWGLLRLVLLDRFYFNPFWGSITIASGSLITVGVLALVHRYAERMSEKRVLITISLCAISSLLFSIADIGLWGYFIILTLYIGEYVLYPFISEVLNIHAPEVHRATVLSVASFLRTLPYVILAPIIGYLNIHDKLEYFLIGWSLLIFVAIALYLATKKRDAQVFLTAE